MSGISSPIGRPGRATTTATMLVAGGLLWSAAAAIGGDEETTRFYTSEVVWLAAQLCLLYGTYALWRLRLHGRSRTGTTGFVMAVAGRTVFVIAEVVALIQGATADELLPAAVLLTAIGMLVAGVAVLRAGTRDRWASLTMLAVGAFPFAFMIPFAASSSDPPPTASLVAWGLIFVALGIATRHATTSTTQPVMIHN